VKPWRDGLQELLRPLLIPKHIWKEVSIDFITSLPESKGCTNLMVVTDRLSKDVVLVGLKDITTESVAMAYINYVVGYHWLPDYITSYRGHGTVHGRDMPGDAACPHQRQNSHPSTPDNSTTMAPIDDAAAAFGSHDSEDLLTLKGCADRFGVDRSTLGRRLRGVTRPKHEVSKQQQNVSPQQEYEIVRYIEGLTKQGLPPTRAMIQNFSSEIAKKRLSERWVSRFLDRNASHLISKWTTGMDATRHKAGSMGQYSLYFDLIHHKIEEYDIKPAHTYNMDEKGFMIGVTGRSKRVFSRSQWEKKEVTASLKDGSREWVTLLATICSDGTALPPGILYASASRSLLSTWVPDIKAGRHDVFISSTPSGWSNNDVGIARLEQVFNRCTKRKARNGSEYRLLIVDGHGSHLTMEFINYCNSHRILLAVLTPHSTHTLQPLDVVLFKPLSNYYSNKLTPHLHRGLGLVPIRKGDFFPLFRRAWQASFKKELILKAFKVTGIWPMDREVVLKRSARTTSVEAQNDENESDWRHLNRLVRSGARETGDGTKQLSHAVHHLCVQNELLQHKNNGLREALTAKEKHKKHGKPLDLQQRQEYHGGAMFWSPQKIPEANAREAVKQRDKHDQ
jgi:hypothetical protein